MNTGLLKKVESSRWAIETVASIQNFNRRVALGNILDITDLKRVDEALRESEKRLRRITDNMLDMISQINAQGILQYVSPSHKSVLGCEPEDLLGRSIFDFAHPDDLNKMMTAYQTALALPGTSRLVHLKYLVFSCTS